MTDFQSREITTASGVTLSYAETGNPRGTAVLLLHGYTDSWRSWGPVMRQMPAHLRTVAVTQRGHGDSDKPEGGYRLADFSDDLAGVLDALGIERAVIAGHSMGTLIATRFAIDHPSRAAGLVLIGAFATLKGNKDAANLWHDAVEGLEDPVPPTLVRAFQQSTLTRPVPPDYFETIVAESLKVPARVWRPTLRAMLDDDFTDALPRIAAPTLLLWGERDEFATQAEQQLLLRTLPDATLRVHAECGHAPNWEDPGETARRIAAFVETRVPQRRPRAAPSLSLVTL